MYSAAIIYRFVVIELAGLYSDIAKIDPYTSTSTRVGVVPVEKMLVVHIKGADTMVLLNIQSLTLSVFTLSFYRLSMWSEFVFLCILSLALLVYLLADPNV